MFRSPNSSSAAPSPANANGVSTPLDMDLQPPAPVVWAWWAVAVVIGLIIIAFTPYTHNLDDIKVTLLHVGGGGLLCLFCWLWMRGYVELPPREIMLPMAGWFVVMIVTTLLHQLGWVPNANRFQWIGWIMIGQYLALLGVFLVMASTLQTWRMVNSTLKFWVGIVVFQCVFGMLHWGGAFKVVYSFLYFNQNPSTLFASLLYTFNKSQDMLGTVLNRQFFGDLLGLWAPLAMGAILIWKRPAQRVFAVLALLLSAPCVYLTFSKAALPFYALSLLITAAGIFFFTSYRTLRIPHLGWILGGVLIVAATLGFFTREDVAQRFKTVEFSLHSRTIIWGGGIAIWREHPILGAGPGCFRVLFPSHRNPDYHLSQISNVTLSAHNRVVDLLCEHGVVGAALYLGFFAMILWQGWRLARRARDERIRVLAIALAGGLIGYFGSALFHPGIRWIIGATPFWAMMGMLAGLSRTEEWHARLAAEKRRREPLPSGARRWRMAALIAALLVWINPLTPAYPFLFSNFGYGIRYFLGAKENNMGLILMGPGIETPPPHIAEQAAKRFQRAVEWNPTFITSYYKKAHAENVAGRIADSLKSYETLNDWAPDYSEIHYNRGILNLILAEDRARQARRESDPQTKAEMEEEAWRFINASRESFAIAARMSNKISVQYQFASVLEGCARLARTPEEKRQRTLEAARVFDHIRDLPLTFATQEPGQREQEAAFRDLAERNAATLFENAGERAEAGRAYYQLFQKEPARENYLIQAVENYRAAGLLEKAVEILESTLERSPFQFRARHLLADILVEINTPESRAKALTQSRILQILEQENPGAISTDIRVDNQRRIESLTK